jgi:3-hydroxyacyl-CoA dehydrogenase
MMIQYTNYRGTAILELCSPPVNAISLAMLDELVAAVRRAEDDAEANGIILTGSAEHFSAGADLAIFEQTRTDDDSVRVSRVFQEAFRAVEESPKPVVAAVAGHVLGGALELAMACHFRVAVETSRFSMPEVNLGINPGAGGTQRLPRLIDPQAALEMLLGGRPIDARKALQCGLVDRLCPAESLRDTAVELLESAPPIRKTRLRWEKLANVDATHAALAAAEERVNSGRPELIAPRMILEAVRTGLEESFAEGSVCEREAFRRCMSSPSTENKIYILAASRRTARRPGLESVVAAPIAEAGVLGMGTMGAGIAQALLTAGLRVTVCDQREEALAQGVERIRNSLRRRVDEGKMPAAKAEAALARLTTSLDPQGLAAADLVVEAVFEDLDIKREAIRRLEAICRPETILATNTSTIDLDELAQGMRHPQRLVGLHFFHPAQQMPLVEVIRRDATPPEVVATALRLVKSLGKTPVVVRNRVGFLVNRLFIPYLVEAFWLLEEGASPTDVDRAMVEFGLPMGPLQLIDMSGLDILMKTQPVMQRAFPHHGDMSAIVAGLVQGGNLGQKSGAGVYRYEPGDRTPRPHDRADAIITAARLQRPTTANLDRTQIVDRLLLRMVAEAFALVEEKVVERPAEIDVAMVLGAGLPDFRGGVLKYAADRGLPTVLADLRRLAEQCGPRYQPCQLLQAAAADPGLMKLAER